MQVVWTRAALRDLEEIQDYVAQDSPLAAHNLATELRERTTVLLAETPMAGRPGRVRDTRELVFANLRYIIAYRVTDRVELLAVVHTAQEWPDDFG